MKILIIHIIVSYDQNISLIFMWKMDPMPGFGIRLVFTLPPRDVHCSTKDAYTSEITFLALHPWEKPSLCLSLSLRVSMSCNNNKHFAFISRPKTFFLQFLSMIKPFRNTYSETLNNEYIERIHQMSYSSLSDNVADI